jgi:uncharacterized protein YprB with RNaseH-like and TPR domain
MRTLLLDIETKPIKAWVWGLWDQNISIGQIIEPTEMLCFGAKWQGSKTKKQVFSSVYHNGKEDMLKELHDLMEEAEVLVGWNSAGFDHKHIKREFLEAGMPPTSTVKDLDLMSVVKANFKFPSNKLDYVAQRLGVGSKFKHTGFQLWIDCINNDPKAWAMMKKYQAQDVVLLDELYDILLPWFPGGSSLSIKDKRDIADLAEVVQ